MNNIRISTAITVAMIALGSSAAMAQTAGSPMSAPATLDRPYGAGDVPPYPPVHKQSGMTHTQPQTMPPQTQADAIAIHSSVGTVSRLEPTRNVMMLDDGAIYQLERAIDVSRLTPGERVEVRYRMDGVNRMASAVIPLQPSAGSTTMMNSSDMGQSSGSALTGPVPVDRGEIAYSRDTRPYEWHSRSGTIGRDDIPGLPRTGDAMGSGLYNGM